MKTINLEVISGGEESQGREEGPQGMVSASYLRGTGAGEAWGGHASSGLEATLGAIYLKLLACPTWPPPAPAAGEHPRVRTAGPSEGTRREGRGALPHRPRGSKLRAKSKGCRENPIAGHRL